MTLRSSQTQRPGGSLSAGARGRPGPVDPGVGNGPASGELRAAPQRLVADRRRAQRQGLLVALLLVLGGAGGAVYLGSRAEATIDVVALARPVQRGQVLTAGDFATVRVSLDGGQVRLATPGLAQSEIAGKAALVDLPRGTLLSPELVAAATPNLGEATVGIRLPIEALPAPRLRPGESVQIVRTDPTTGKAEEVVTGALVQAVTSSTEMSETAAGDDVVVHVAVPAVVAEKVAGAASVDGGVRLLGVRP